MTERESVIACPECGSETEEELHDDAPHAQYECLSCGVVLRPLPGDHCVFCSYGSVPCLPVQRAMAAGAGADLETEHAAQAPAP